MKKILALAATALIFTTSIFAIGLAGAGAKFGVNFGGAGTTLEGDTKKSADYIEDKYKHGNIGGGFGFYALLDIVDLDFGILYVQPEINFNFNNGFNVDDKDHKYEEKIYTHTLDLPVLVTLEVPVADMFEVGGGLGLQFAFPLKSDVETTLGSNSSKASSNYDKISANPNIGLIFDANGKFLFGSKKVKHFAAVLDLRYTLDFAKTSFDFKKGKVTVSEEMFTRRFLSIWAGAEYRF